MFPYVQTKKHVPTFCYNLGFIFVAMINSCIGHATVTMYSPKKLRKQGNKHDIKLFFTTDPITFLGD